MTINDYLKEKNITKYKLSKDSGVPYATISDICTGKAKIERCAADTLYKLSKALNITMEDLIADNVEFRQSFETFKSNIRHMVKDMGDIDFIIDTLESDEIQKLYQKRRYPESLYLLAMLDYISRENDIPLCTRYNEIRSVRLQETLYPLSVIALSAVSNSENPKQLSFQNAIPEFIRFNIVENEVRNVY